MLIPSALAVVATWVLITVVLIGIGSILLKFFEIDLSLMDAFWMGLAVSVAILEIWNLLVPLTASATALLLCLGILGCTANRSVLWNLLGIGLRTSRWLILLQIAIVLFLALRAVGPCLHYDTGLYGASAVRWISTYPTVPGLANLYGRLGFNSSAHLCFAALDTGVWKGLSFHLFTGYLMAAMCLTILPACVRVARRCPKSAADWFQCVLAIPLIFWVIRGQIVGMQTDEPATIACLVATAILFEELAKDGDHLQESPGGRLVVAAVLFSLAVTFKMSTIVFAAIAWCLTLGRLYFIKQAVRDRRPYIAGALVLSTVILFPWCLRGVILSGYPFYPATAMGLPVEWKNPQDAANLEAAWTHSYGRKPDARIADTQGYLWLPGWWHQAVRNRSAIQVPLVISLIGFAVVLAHRLRRSRVSSYRWLLILFPSLAGVAFWFLASPDPRFGQFAIWATAGTLATWGIESMGGVSQGRRVSTVLAGLLGLLLWCLISFGWKQPYESMLAAKPLSPLPKVGLTARQTSSGLRIYLPQQDNQCWDAPLPCTPYPDDTLRLRDRGNMRWGFTSEGRPDRPYQ
jgi:hypothetical protein